MEPDFSCADATATALAESRCSLGGELILDSLVSIEKQSRPFLERFDLQLKLSENKANVGWVGARIATETGLPWDCGSHFRKEAASATTRHTNLFAAS
jgi:hypothetical protein